jgi:hypothetical protein
VSRAVLYLRGARSMRPCLDYACARGHEIVAIVLDPDGLLWLTGVEQMIAAGEADIAVVADRGQIPPQPRVEVVVEQGQDRPNPPPVLRRPRVLPRANSAYPVYRRPERRNG